MSVSRLLVDSDICIDVSRNFAPSIERLERAEQTAALAVSAITYMELLIGCANKRQQQVTERFVRRFLVVPIDAAISDRAMELLRRYHLSHSLLIGDALVAATALAQETALLTRNTRDFQFIAGLVLEPYA